MNSSDRELEDFKRLLFCNSQNSKMSKFFVKFQYKDTIKKIQLSKEDLTWNNVCQIIEKSFLLSEKSKIQLKYKDLENDEITVTSDEDLAEAYNLYFMKNLVKFFVHSSGVFDENPKGNNENCTVHSKMLKSDELQESEEPKSAFPQTSENKFQNSENAGLTKSQKEALKVKIDVQEIENIFSEVFSSTEIITKIREKLDKYIKDKQLSHVKEGDITEFQIDTDYSTIANHLVTSLNKIMNTKLDSSFQVIETPKEESKTNTNLNIPLTTSIYEPVTESMFLKQSTTPEGSGSLSSSTSLLTSSVCKDLTSSHGVKLVLKYENGKAKFITVPSPDDSLKETISKGYEKLEKVEEKPNSEIEVEEIMEPVENLVLNLKRTSSKDTKEKSLEFQNKILKANKHDLDDDLPAPYDHNKVQNVEVGLKGTVYEKIK